VENSGFLNRLKLVGGAARLDGEARLAGVEGTGGVADPGGARRIVSHTLYTPREMEGLRTQYAHGGAPATALRSRMRLPSPGLRGDHHRQTSDLA